MRRSSLLASAAMAMLAKSVTTTYRHRDDQTNRNPDWLVQDLEKLKIRNAATRERIEWNKEVDRKKSERKARRIAELEKS